MNAIGKFTCMAATKNGSRCKNGGSKRVAVQKGRDTVRVAACGQHEQMYKNNHDSVTWVTKITSQDVREAVNTQGVLPGTSITTEVRDFMNNNSAEIFYVLKGKKNGNIRRVRVVHKVTIPMNHEFSSADLHIALNNAPDTEWFGILVRQGDNRRAWNRKSERSFKPVQIGGLDIRLVR